jgi:hypothetical protein
MDATEPHVAQELDRRLGRVREEWQAGHAPPLARADLLALVGIIAMAELVGVLAVVAR